MSPVIDIQRQMRELGRIRMGDKKGTNGSQRRLEHFRLTSPSEGLLRAAAAIYGGQVTEWDGSPNPPEFELYTETSLLRVAIPPSEEPYTQWYEVWSKGGCQRRCDGQTALVAQDNGARERPCVCAANGLDGRDRDCDLVTRAPFFLPDVPGIGVWRLESKGWNVAKKLTGTLGYLAMQASRGVFIRGELRLVSRSRKVPGDGTHRWVEPILDTPDVTIGMLMDGEVVSGALPSGMGQRPALPSTAAAPSGEDAGFQDPVASGGDPGWGQAPDPPAGDDAARGEGTVISQAQRKRLFAMSREAGLSEDELRTLVAAHRTDGETSTGGLAVEVYDAICRDVQTLIDGGRDAA